MPGLAGDARAAELKQNVERLLAARVGYFLPVAADQRTFQRIQQVEAGLEAGAAHLHEGIHGADRGHVLQRPQADLAQPRGGFRADVA